MSSSEDSSRSTTPMQDSTSLCLEWDSIFEALNIHDEAEQINFLLAPAFLSYWADFRDLLPLKPGDPTALSIVVSAEDVLACANRIYEKMLQLYACVYEYQSLAERQNQEPLDHFQSLVYLVTRRLAVPGGHFVAYFPRYLQRTVDGKMRALEAIQDIIKLVLKLAEDYVASSTNVYVRAIEEAKPANNPELSPLPEVRKRWRLEHSSVEELRNEVLGHWQGTGKTEKELLVGLLMGEIVLML